MPIITIDPYYDVNFYNESKEALKNNNVKFTEYIYIKPSYDWYLDVDQLPIMVNYDRAGSTETKWMVGLVQPLRPNEQYILLRRQNDVGAKAIAKFIENEPLRDARTSDYAVFFNVKNRDTAINLSKNYPGKIWYFGKYYDNKYRVCLATHRTIRGFLDENQVLLERSGGTMSKPGEFEAYLNYKVFREQDRLVKFTEMPYFDKGIYYPPRIKGDQSGRFLIS